MLYCDMTKIERGVRKDLTLHDLCSSLDYRQSSSVSNNSNNTSNNSGTKSCWPPPPSSWNPIQISFLSFVRHAPAIPLKKQNMQGRGQLYLKTTSLN